MAPISVVVEGTDQELQAGTTGMDLFGKRKEVVAMTVDGTEVDLATALTDGTVVDVILKDSPQGLAILRHSAAHVLAQAVQEANPSVDLGIGPPILDGFYYDFGVDQPFTPDSFHVK